jgi:YVTN family beta-propeller protein
MSPTPFKAVLSIIALGVLSACGGGDSGNAAALGSTSAKLLSQLRGSTSNEEKDSEKEANKEERETLGKVATTLLPTGQDVTPMAVPGSVAQLLNPKLPAYPNFVAGEAVRSQLSPDGKTLAVVTAGQNSLYLTTGVVDKDNSTQYIFLYDVTSGTPKLAQVIKQTNAYVSLVFKDNNTLYSGGGTDDAVYAYTKTGSIWAQAAKIALGHGTEGAVGLGRSVRANAGSVALSSDGATLVVANNYNDSITVIDTKTNAIRYEHDLRPYFSGNESVAGAIGGTYPFAVVIKGNGTAYVSSARDREVVVVDISNPVAGKLIKRVPLDGNGLGMTFDAAQARLFVAQDNADQVAVIDTTTNTVTKKIDVRGPAALFAGTKQTGAATFSATLSRDGKTLYAVNAGANNIAVIPLTGKAAFTVTGLIPTAYEPHDITFSADGSRMFIVNGKSATGPNPGHLAGSTDRITSVTYPGGNAAAASAARASNQYQFQLEKAMVMSAPVPTARDLLPLTEQVVANNNYVHAREGDEEVMSFIKSKIKHVIYIVKENRTYDQVLGDLGNGANGDPKLTQFGSNLTPNYHALAKNFVTLDNFMDPGDGSMDGWSWAMQGRTTNTNTINQQLNYAAVTRGVSYDSEGTNRNVPVNWATAAQRDAVSGTTGTTNYSTATASAVGGTINMLPGVGNHASADAPYGAQKGYIFNAVLNAGLTVRNYGFLVNNIGSIGTIAAPVSDPFTAGVVQVGALEPTLAPFTDLYFRGYDQAYPDQWRYREWKREFDQFVIGGNLPSLSTVRVSHDHMGSFATALGGVNTPETQQADCDYATGKIVEAVANSPFAKDTIIVIVEDDVQDGPDHVDSHRAPAFVIGPYVKQGAVISTRYTQVNALRTIEDILGTQHINLNTAFQRPMTDVFDVEATGKWTFAATASTVLSTTSLNLAQAPNSSVRYAAGPIIKPKHSATYWARATAGMDFREADQVDPAKFNQILWKGLTSSKPFKIKEGTKADATIASIK